MRYVLLREMVIGLDATFSEEIIVRETTPTCRTTWAISRGVRRD